MRILNIAYLIIAGVTLLLGIQSVTALQLDNSILSTSGNNIQIIIQEPVNMTSVTINSTDIVFINLVTMTDIYVQSSNTKLYSKNNNQILNLTFSSADTTYVFGSWKKTPTLRENTATDMMNALLIIIGFFSIIIVIAIAGFFISAQKGNLDTETIGLVIITIILSSVLIGIAIIIFSTVGSVT